MLLLLISPEKIILSVLYQMPKLTAIPLSPDYFSILESSLKHLLQVLGSTFLGFWIIFIVFRELAFSISSRTGPIQRQSSQSQETVIPAHSWQMDVLHGWACDFELMHLFSMHRWLFSSACVHIHSYSVFVHIYICTYINLYICI